MRTIIDIDERLLREAMALSGSKTKKGAIVAALQEYVRSRRRDALKDMIGNYDLDLNLEDLEHLRDTG